PDAAQSSRAGAAGVGRGPGAHGGGHRYQRQMPGEMIHIDIKKLGRFERIGHRITGDRTGQSNSRGIGWEFVHVAIKPAPAQAGDAWRIAFSLVMPNERKESATAFLKAALAYYQSLRV